MRTTTDGQTMHAPVHPGAFLREAILKPYDLSVTTAAGVLGVGRPALSNLLNGRAALSGDMALRVEKAFGVRLETLMQMQASYDIAQTRLREKTITLRRYRGGRREGPPEAHRPSR